MTQRKMLRKAFITVIGTVALGGGCTNTVTTEGEPCSFGDPGCDASCPSAKPASGVPCSQAGQECWYSNGECEDFVATCNGTWTVDQVACNPPPPELCWSAADETACAAVGFCSWFVPACEGSTLPAAGCYPADGCNLCLGDCIDVNVHPCPDGSCNSCSIGQQVCVTPSG